MRLRDTWSRPKQAKQRRLRGGDIDQAEEDELPAQNGDARERVLREIRQEIRARAREGMSAKEIDEHLNGHRNLTEAEQELAYILAYHAVAEIKGHY